MKDLDFDELDRAVNSIMSGTKRASNPASTGDTSHSALQGETSAPMADATIPSGMPVPMSVPSAEPETTPLARPAERKPPAAARRGRFMDVVRPGAQQSEPVSARVSRQGATIEPSGPLVTDIIPTSAVPPVAKAPSPAVTSAKEGKDVRQSLVQTEADWPDPIDLSQATTVSEDTEPLSSPFLSDAKVEKRPLGSGLGASKPQPDTETEKAAEAPRDDQIQLTPAPPDTSAPLPEELSSDVMALESDANTMAIPADEAKTEVARQVVEQKKDVLSGSPQQPTVAPEAVARTKETSPLASVSSEKRNPEPASPGPEPVVPKGPISIPQQYREEPSTGDTGNGAIYDTETYHDQPLAHPKKKKSGWLWVVWIILILVIGAAGGAALYWFGVF